MADLVRSSGVWVRYDDQFVREIPAEQSLRQAESDGYIFIFTATNATEPTSAGDGGAAGI